MAQLDNAIKITKKLIEDETQEPVMSAPEEGAPPMAANDATPPVDPSEVDKEPEPESQAISLLGQILQQLIQLNQTSTDEETSDLPDDEGEDEAATPVPELAATED